MANHLKIFELLKLIPFYIMLKLHNVNYGKYVFGNTCNIINKGTINIGNHVSLKSFPNGEMYKVCLYSYFSSSLIQIGDRCSLNGTIIYCRNSVTIGDYCMFGPGAIISDNSSHNLSIDPIIRRTGKINEAPVILEQNVWVGRRSIIMKGVRIGKNSIITPNSVVHKNVLSNSIYGGNPAKFIKTI